MAKILLGNIKGESAKITDVTASVDNTTGTPSVTVTMGGTENERSFNFAFSGLKGETGNAGEPGIATVGDDDIHINEEIPIYEEATELEPLTSGEKISIAFGKIKKAISELISHLGSKNPHGITKADVELGNVDNTSDADKPVSTAQATAIADAKKSGTDAQGNLTAHIGDTTKHITADERTAWNGKANASHSHSKSEITDFPTSLPASDVPSWAKQSTKPTYTASEVGACPSSHASTATTYGVGTSSNYGHLKITDAVDSTATDTAASAKALKTVNDMISSLSGSSAKFKFGSYVGNGKFGESNPNTLTFDFTPKLILFIGVYSKCSVTFAHYAKTEFETAGDGICPITFSNNSVSWYNKGKYDGGSVTSTDRWAEWQANLSGTTYYYVAIGV